MCYTASRLLIGKCSVAWNEFFICHITQATTCISHPLFQYCIAVTRPFNCDIRHIARAVGNPHVGASKSWKMLKAVLLCLTASYQHDVVVFNAEVCRLVRYLKFGSKLSRVVCLTVYTSWEVHIRSRITPTIRDAVCSRKKTPFLTSIACAICVNFQQAFVHSSIECRIYRPAIFSANPHTGLTPSDEPGVL
jgi:hypothetical protein